MKKDSGLSSINLNLLFLLDWPYYDNEVHEKFIVDLLTHPNINQNGSEDYHLDSDRVFRQDVADYVETIISKSHYHIMRSISKKGLRPHKYPQFIRSIDTLYFNSYEVRVKIQRENKSKNSIYWLSNQN